MGYTPLDDEFHCFAGDYLDSLKLGMQLVEDQAMVVKMSRMSEDERKKQEILNQRKAEFAAKQLQEKKRKEELQRLSMMDRKAKGQEEVKASKANELKFGANLVKFEPPAERGG